jgi:predicted transcriptional regulator
VERLTPRETEIMNVLWDRGPSTVAEVRDALNDGSAYTTILTLMRVLEEKGIVARRSEGKAHRYRALVRREAARSRAVEGVLGQFFRGSAELLLTQLVARRDLDDEALLRLRTLLDERLARGDASRGDEEDDE